MTTNKSIVQYNLLFTLIYICLLSKLSLKIGIWGSLTSPVARQHRYNQHAIVDAATCISTVDVSTYSIRCTISVIHVWYPVLIACTQDTIQFTKTQNKCFIKLLFDFSPPLKFAAMGSSPHGSCLNPVLHPYRVSFFSAVLFI